MGGLIGVVTESKNGLFSKNMYASKFRSASVDYGKVVSFIIPRYTRGALKVITVTTQNLVSFAETTFIVDMNTGKLKGYNIDTNAIIRYKMESQYDIIYMKFNASSPNNVYLQYMETIADDFIKPISILDEFPSDAVEI